MPLSLSNSLSLAALAGRGAGAAPFTPAYDDYTASIVHAYEPARRVLTSYTGNLLRLRRDSDDAESDFGYDASDDLDTAAISTWLGGASGYCVTVYDQKGSDDITQATAAAQPLYVASMQNSKPGLRFDGANHYLRGAFTNGGQLSQPYNVLLASKLDTAAVNDGNYRHVVSSNSIAAADRFFFRQHAATTPDKWELAAITALLGSATSDSWLVVSLLLNGASSQFWLNGTSGATGDAGTGDATGLTIGANYNGANLWDGDWLGASIFDPSLSTADRGGMETAYNSYYSIY